jgi:hypothetical protein
VTAKASEGWLRRRADGVDLFVRLTPRAAADRLDGVVEDAAGRLHLAVHLRALPEKGAANAALERLLAGQFGIARSTASVVAGHTSRLKTVRLAGDPETLSATAKRIAALE